MPVATDQNTPDSDDPLFGNTPTPESIRARALGDPLVKAIDAWVSNPNAETLAAHDALLINRCAEMAVSAVSWLHRRIAEIEAQR